MTITTPVSKHAGSITKSILRAGSCEIVLLVMVLDIMMPMAALLAKAVSHPVLEKKDTNREPQ